jgi:hypothetical protein
MNHHLKITGKTEERRIFKVEVDPNILRKIFYTIPSFGSFNLMVMTTDRKVLLLQRTQSFHFPKVIKDLKSNKINSDLLKSLYTSELNKIKTLVKIPDVVETSKLIFMFPGGQSKSDEIILLTLLREFEEETSININLKELKFNQSTIFKVSIFDFLIKKKFNNLVFPVKINMTSRVLAQKFKETKHVKNPIFFDIRGKNLFEVFVEVQKHILL